MRDTARAILAAEPLDGEPWHSDYEKKDPEGFRLMVESTVNTERRIYSVFRSMVNELDDLVNWYEYETLRQQKLQGAAKDLLKLLESAGWIKVTQDMNQAITLGLGQALLAGGRRAEKDTNIVMGWTQHDPAAQEFLRKYSFELVKGINDVTRERMRQSLLSGIQSGLNQDAMTLEIEKVIKDKNRSATIANTEVVRAYNVGRKEAMERTGLKYTWEWLDNQPDSCEICQELHGKEAARSGKNKGLFYSKVLGIWIANPPVHPHCRCSMTAKVL